uniref:Synaptopodin 2 n=1 Tax=Cyprinus carpio TaxID=7962 RepID=A0A8C2DN54_CYPCA
MVSTTFRIPSPSRPHELQELYTSESQDEAYYGETDSDGECPARTRLVRTQVQIPASRNKSRGTNAQGGGDTSVDVTPGSVVELQLSFSKTTLEEPDCTGLGSACGVVGDIHQRKTDDSVSYTTTAFTPANSLYIPRQDRQPLGQRGVLVSKPPALPGQVEVTVQESSRSSSEKEGLEASQRLDSGGEEGGYIEEAPTSLSVSFGLPSEECDSESEREVNEPNKHRARHARLRRSESLSEKQVKEAKSKCKRIALLLSAPAPNPNNKGVLMFKKHRQRAKKYTLVSYGTGEDEPDYKDDEDDTVEFTVLGTSETEIDEDFFTNVSGQKSIVSFDWDTGLLEIERKLDSQQGMDALPETKGKGVLMFAQRKQRMDEIVEEHEEMRRKGIPVEAVHEPETHQTYQHMEEQTYMHAQENQSYMDVNLHHSLSAQKQQQQQQYHQYQEQYYQQQQQQQQQQQYQEYQKQLQYQHQQQQYQPQQDYQQQKMYQHMQSYNQQQHCQQQQVQQYSHHMNGMFDQQMQNETQPLVTNRIAKPFSVQNRVAAPFSSSSSADNQEQPGYSLGQGEQIASRDERISVPAIKTGILQDTRRRSANKPMFTFKESPKVSPNPALLNLLNRNDKKAGLEFCSEEDYLSLGAEACNFLQSSKTKHKIPPPVAPKPHINPASPPWSIQQETTDQPIPQQTENSVPAEDPVTEADTAFAPAPEMGAPMLSEEKPTFAPESHDVPHCPEQLPPDNTWKQQESQMELNQQPETWNEKQPQPQINSAPVAPPVTQSDPSVRSWDPAPNQSHQQIPVSTWGPNEVQLQVPSQNQSQTQPQWMTQSQGPLEVQVPSKTQSQPSWVTQPQTSSPTKHQSQPQPQINTWAPSSNQSTPQAPWSQPHELAQPSINVWQQDQNQAQEHPAWSQQQQLTPHWASSHQQQPQPSWTQPQMQSQPQPPRVSQAKQQEPTQPSANAWTQPQSPIQAQPPWAQQTQPPPQPTAPVQQPMNPWPPMPDQSPPHPQWGQDPASQQAMNSWSPAQNQIQPPWTQPLPPTQPQAHPPWAPKPQQPAPQLPVSQWAPPQSQSQPVVNAWAPQHQQSSVSSIAQNESQKLPPQPIKPWSPTQTSQPTPPRRMNSYTTGTKAPSPVPTRSTMSPSGFGSAFEMPALKGKGAELFAKRQSRMEKYIVDSTTVQNKARPSSPSPSLPNSWKYSPNCRAPPPLAYNPIHSPSYPPGAIKQPPPSSPSTANKNKSKDKQKRAPKPLHVLDVMKHQPYQLNSSLFTYGPAAEKLAAEKEAAEKLAAQKAAEAQAQAQAQIQAQALGPPNQNHQMGYNQGPPPYGFMPQQAQQPYGMAGQSPMQDDLYHQPPSNTYQPALNSYQQHPQQVPYQQEYNPQQAYQQPSVNPYQQAPSPPYQQPSPPSYQTGPNPVYLAGPALSYQPAPSSYVVPSYPVAARAESASGGSIIAAPKPKFSAKKSAAQVWKPSTPEK